MRDFIRRHWLAYLIGALVAIGVGAIAAYVVGVKASTPAEVRQARIAAEKKHVDSRNQAAEASKGADTPANEGSAQ